MKRLGQILGGGLSLIVIGTGIAVLTIDEHTLSSTLSSVPGLGSQTKMIIAKRNSLRTSISYAFSDIKLDAGNLLNQATKPTAFGHKQVVIVDMPERPTMTDAGMQAGGVSSPPLHSAPASNEQMASVNEENPQKLEPKSEPELNEAGHMMSKADGALQPEEQSTEEQSSGEHGETQEAETAKMEMAEQPEPSEHNTPEQMPLMAETEIETEIEIVAEVTEHAEPDPVHVAEMPAEPPATPKHDAEPEQPPAATEQAALTESVPETQAAKIPEMPQVHGDPNIPGDTEHQTGLLYYRGTDVSQDYAVAANWFKKAAAMGHGGAEYNLGIMYYLGKGLEKDFNEAAKWFESAANQENPAAQYNLGLLYYNGKGVQKDPEVALMWFERAAKLGDKKAKAALNTLSKPQS